MPMAPSRSRVRDLPRTTNGRATANATQITIGAVAGDDSSG